MLQVKFREDLAKGGFVPQQLINDWPKLNQLNHLRLVGLMTMSPICLGLEERINLFKDCRFLADQLSLPDCSMGMSNDWQQAVQAGATWLRLGSALFGERPKNVNSSTDITKSG